MVTTRAPRAKPKALPLCPTERDYWILEGLMKMRYLRTSQLAELYFDGSRDAANKRLRKLAGSGLIRAWVTSLSEENVYSVTSLGIKTLAYVADDITITGSAPHTLDGNLEHLLGINQVRVSLTFALSDIGGKLEGWLSDWDLRAHHKEPVVPDAIFQLSDAGNKHHLMFLEVDNNTRSHQRFLAKMRRYASRREQRLAVYGYPEYTLLVVGKAHRTTDRYRRTLDTRRYGGWTWFTTQSALSDEDTTAPIWQPVDNDHYYSLQDLLTVRKGWSP